MISLGYDIKIYLRTGHTDMRKGVNGLSLLASGLVAERTRSNTMFVFRGKSADKIKVLWWDGQGFCLFYKCLDSGKFTWPNCNKGETLCVTKAQLSMLLEGIDWRKPSWSQPPKYTG